MADVYTTLVDGSYLLHRPFYLPTKDGPVWAIAFTTNGGTLLTAAISVVLTLIFMSLWNLICFIAVLFPGSKLRRRHLALVTLWNSNDSWFAFKELASYAYHFWGSKSDFAYGLLLAVLALMVFGGSMTLGIIGPSLVQIGTVAPVRPSSVYYPYLGTDNTSVLAYYGVLAPANLRALGSIEASKVTKRKDVNLPDSDDPIGQTESGENIYQYLYDYTLTGVDFGLQQGSPLSVTVNGSCTTEYGWYVNDTDPAADNDVYNPWKIGPHVSVPIGFNDIQYAPKASFVPHPDADQQFSDSGNRSFAIFVWAARRASIKQGDDPWYKTEPRPPTKLPAPFNAQFWMKRGRPALSCWQKDTWRYGPHEVKNVFHLPDIPGIKVKPALLSLLAEALAEPVLKRIGNASGDSALKSTTTSANGVINAEASKISYDLERLVLASYVFTRNVLLDSTMFSRPDGLDNMMEDGTGQPADGAGDFVLSSPDFQTFSMVGLIVLFVMLVTLLITQTILDTVVRRHTAQHNNGDKEDRLKLFKALPAAQLFRRMYEPTETTDSHWQCDSQFPSDKDPTVFEWVECGEKHSHCNGHINRIPASGPELNTDRVGNSDNSLARNGGNKFEES
ncbi:hypothetical protein BBK36DRAFT_1110847 [Trichoderma citrinoviride]|uniref:Uncharacterized protein n=1 Tax=Trichoderma citrinoviride TaxID=58853 RepID=A0A2T4BJA3_9HYPO|nr:hypothetical protein BBK36DRAFT_1110847 [Trichoderma citrinoviride]PTB69397.1 hypothetical protein BBK36DRAFT_1110847 [Trichoderma citrinoviride]